jgi:hypothetical protein
MTIKLSQYELRVQTLLFEEGNFSIIIQAEFMVHPDMIEDSICLN